MKYISPALVIACSHPSGSGPMFAFDDAAFATTGFDGRNEKGHSYITYTVLITVWQLCIGNCTNAENQVTVL